MDFFNKNITNFLIKFSGRLGIDVRYFIKGGFWLSLPLIVNNLMGFARSIFFARLLTKNVYGQFGFVNDTVSTLAFLTLPGLSNALVETVARGNYGGIFDAARARIRWGALLTLAALVFCVYYLWDGQSTLAMAFLVVGLMQPIASSYSLIKAYYNGRKQFDKVSLLSVGQILLNTGTLLFVLWLDKGLVWLVAANYGTNLIFYGIFYHLATRNIHNASRDLEVVTYGRSLTWANFILDISSSLDGFILGITGGFLDVAVYRVASAIPKSAKGPLQFLRPLIMPKIAEKPGKQIYTARVRKQLLILFVANLLFIGTLIVLIPYLIPIIYGDIYLGAIIYAQLLLLSLIFGLPNAFFLAALQARKQTQAIAKANLIFGVLLIGTMIILTPVLGIMGIIISRLFARWGGTLYRWRVVSKL